MKYFALLIIFCGLYIVASERPTSQGGSSELQSDSKFQKRMAFVKYNMCQSSPPNFINATARPQDPNLPHKFNLTVKEIFTHGFLFELVRTDEPTGWDTMLIVDWVIYTGLPTSCKEALRFGLNESGIQRIYNPGNQQTLEVYCDQTTDGGGWMVFQRRRDGSENFYRTWVEYKGMFGNLSNEFWLGNENLHALTRSGNYELRIELEDCANVRKFAKYSSFSIGSAHEKYTLKVTGYTGNAGDSLYHHNGRPFSTKDVDNDSSNANCAVNNHGAWWYGECYHSNLNGEYLKCQTTTTRAASWGLFRGAKYSLKFIEMKFRPIGD